MKYLRWRPYLRDLLSHRRRDESASGRGFSAKKKTTQPGTGAQAMEKPIQTSLVHTGGGEEGENPRNVPDPSELREPQAAAPSAAEFWRFLLLPEVTSEFRGFRKYFHLHDLRFTTGSRLLTSQFEPLWASELGRLPICTLGSD